jgi:hypothetical protein
MESGKIEQILTSSYSHPHTGNTAPNLEPNPNAILIFILIDVHVISYGYENRAVGCSRKNRE